MPRPYDPSRSRAPARGVSAYGQDDRGHSARRTYDPSEDDDAGPWRDRASGRDGERQGGGRSRGSRRAYDDRHEADRRGSRATRDADDGGRRSVRRGSRSLRDQDDFDPGSGPAWPGDDEWNGGAWEPGEGGDGGRGAWGEPPGRARYARNAAGNARGRRGGDGTRAAGGGSRRPRRRVGLIVGAVVATLVLACGTSLAAYSLYSAPAGAAAALCAALRQQDYAKAYATLSSGAKSAIAADQFVSAIQSLDQIQGKVTSCGTGSLVGGYQYHFGSSATVTATISRAGGASLKGGLTVIRQAGEWKIDHLDASLFGINLLALTTVTKYCIALQGQDYTGLFALLDSKALAGATAATFAQVSQWHDIVDGQVQSCAVTHLGQGDSEAAASVTLSVNRQKLGAKQGALTLDIERGAWKVSGVDTRLQGTNVTPLLTATHFCQDISGQQYADLPTVLDANAANAYPGQSLANLFNGVDTGLKWTSCLIDPTTYQLSGTGASVAAGFVLADFHGTAVGHGSVVIGLVVVSGKWEVDNWSVQA